MKVVIAVEVTDEHLRRVRAAASPDAEVVVATEPGPLREAVRTADALFGHFDADLFERAGRLRWVQTLGAGVDGLLFPDFVASDIVLTSEKGHVGPHLAEHAFALLLALTRGVARAARERTWTNKASIRAASWELSGRTMGIVGLGGTGREVARRAAAFGLRCLAVDPEPVARPPEVEAVWGLADFHRLLGESDVVVICAPLAPSTRGLVDQAAFAAMRPHAILINVTRGAIVDDAALIEALRAGRLGGAGLDVTPVEPLPADHPLWAMDNVIITPHTAGASPLRLDRAVDLFCRNLESFRTGAALESVIDKTKGY